ncbi:uncharacterized protein A4U43_C04F33950 [Asparagus officinalis]|uniref:Uncharacterized protein n=1 Tax=Asparagus officinalis TaxID=4686 RepID=A0A5P1FAJ2_ASPOF|nr:uncharacterized protein A4U43_C04F33950 [Asparagus officinalis]
MRPVTTQESLPATMENEEGDFSIVEGHIHVYEASAISITKTENRSEDVGDDDTVPFYLGEHHEDDNERDYGEDYVSEKVNRAMKVEAQLTHPNRNQSNYRRFGELSRGQNTRYKKIDNQEWS